MSKTNDIIIGVDLGTTNSCVAVWQSGESTVIPNAEGAVPPHPLLRLRRPVSVSSAKPPSVKRSRIQRILFFLPKD